MICKPQRLLGGDDNDNRGAISGGGGSGGGSGVVVVVVTISFGTVALRRVSVDGAYSPSANTGTSSSSSLSLSSPLSSSSSSPICTTHQGTANTISGVGKSVIIIWLLAMLSCRELRRL